MARASAPPIRSAEAACRRILVGTSGGNGIALDGSGNIFIANDGGIEEILPPAATPLFSSVLPGARAVAIGATPTIFASMINTGATPLNNCLVALTPATTFGNPAGLTLNYQTTNPASNVVTGTPNTPVTIPGNDGVQTFLLAFGDTGEVNQPWPVTLNFQCDGVPPAETVPGINTVDLTIQSSIPSPDIIALVATPTNDGVIRVPLGGAAAFSVASINLGVEGSVGVSVDTGTTVLPAVVTICQTNPSTAQCLAPPAAALTVDIAAGAAPTFSVFVQATGPIAFAPAQSRIFVRFGESFPQTVGSTSVAIATR